MKLHTVMIILRDDDISPLAQIDERQVDRVSSCPNDFDCAVIGRQHMVCIAQKRHRDTVPSGCLLRYACHRAGIRINSLPSSCKTPSMLPVVDHQLCHAAVNADIFARDESCLLRA